MNPAVPPCPPDPSAALEAALTAILDGPMRDVPILNPQLPVAAIGLRRLGPAWFGALLTPWFVNLVLVPDAAPAAAPGTAAEFDLPCGTLGFLHARYGELHVLCCSLLSPVPPLYDEAGARLFAAAALDAVLTPPAPPPRAGLSRRELLCGRGARPHE